VANTVCSLQNLEAAVYIRGSLDFLIDAWFILNDFPPPTAFRTPSRLNPSIPS
jgi:hypothetical protein